MYWHVFPCASTRPPLQNPSRQPRRLGCPAAASTAQHECAGSKSRSCHWGHETGPTRQTRAGAHPRDQAKKQCRRAARHQQLLTPVSGERHEDLHDEKENLHQHRSAPQSAQKCVPEKHVELLVVLCSGREPRRQPEPPRPGTGMSAICEAVRFAVLCSGREP